MTDRVVFDCNVYFQALISPKGPAGECVAAVVHGRLVLFTTTRVLQELRDVCLRPHLAQRFALTAARVDEFIREIMKLASVLQDVPHVFDYPRDPHDEHYVDLAVAANAQLVVSRDKDLLDLQDSSTATGSAFRHRFPTLQIVTPTELINYLRAGDGHS